MSSEIQSLKRYFETRSSHVSDYWLQCCVEWFKGEYNTYTENFLCSSVYQQWLDSDLREIEVRCLPNNLNQEKKTTINGKYVLQVLYIKDISKPAYTQLKNMRDMYKLTRGHINTDVEQVEASGKRVLQLFLTDGVQEITAFEYELVSCLKLFLTPGVKLLFTGPLLVRNGEFMLKDHNVQVVGGEIEALKVVNAAENVLARALNMPENNNPRITEDCKNNNGTNTEMSTYAPHTTSDRSQNTVNTTNTVQNNVNNHNNMDTNHEGDLEVDQFLADFDTSTIEAEENILQQGNCDDFDENDELFENLNFTEPHTDNNQEGAFGGEPDYDGIQQRDLEEAERMELESMIEEVEDFHLPLEDVTLDAIMEQSKPKQKTLPTITAPDPFVYTEYLEKNLKNLSTTKTYRVKARFVNNVEKLKLSKDTGWTMKFEIADSSGRLTVGFVSDIIQELLEMSPSEAFAENTSVKKKESKSHEKLLLALGKCKKKLQSLEYIVTLKFDKTNFTVVSLEPLSERHLDEIKKKVDEVPDIKL